MKRSCNTLSYSRSACLPGGAVGDAVRLLLWIHGMQAGPLDDTRKHLSYRRDFLVRDASCTSLCAVANALDKCLETVSYPNVVWYRNRHRMESSREDPYRCCRLFFYSSAYILHYCRHICCAVDVLGALQPSIATIITYRRGRAWSRRRPFSKTCSNPIGPTPGEEVTVP